MTDADDASRRPPDDARARLRLLYDAVAARCDAVAADLPGYPCRRGCSSCCARLADVPRATEAEWALVAEGIGALDAGVREGVEARIAALAADERDRASRPVACPLLDAASGACLVYDARPLACRTYGFYASRGDGLWCDLVATHAARLGDDAVVRGNHLAAEADARAASPRVVSMLAWFADLADAGGRARP